MCLNRKRELLTKLVTGGQTGVDLGALEAAHHLNIPTGGWCPPLVNDYWISVAKTYGLTPTKKELSILGKEIPRSLRTEFNVRDTDGTLIMLPNPSFEPDEGTLFSERIAKIYEKPVKRIYLSNSEIVTITSNWLIENQIKVLNVSGPSEENCPGIRELVKKHWISVVERLFS